MYKVEINNKEIDVRDGFTIKDELNETLDSGTIQFMHENGESEIEPFDSVVIKNIEARLPSDYQEVEYIESNGEEAILLGGIIYGVSLSLDFELVGANHEKAIFGAGSGANHFMFRVYNNNYDWYGSGVALTSTHIGVRQSVKASHTQVKINGTVYNQTDTKTDDSDLFIFATNNSATDGSSIKVFDCKVYLGNEVVKHLIPCYRKSDNVIGLYDIIQNIFYTSEFGTFSKGANVVDSVKSRKKLLVDTYASEIVNFNKNDLFKSDFFYTSNMFSETKKLERITLPNLSITARATGTQRTVASYIIQYLKEYAPKINVYYSTALDEQMKHRELRPSICYDFSINSKFNMPCPEFVWNTPTLKEVLTDLMSVADCIPVIKENVLTYIDLSRKGNAIDTSKLTDYRTSGTSADYCDTLTLPMKNVLSKQPIIVNELLLPHSTSGEMTSNNAVYLTKKPIYKIRSAKLFVYGNGIDYNDGTTPDIRTLLVSGDITNQIVEKAKFDILSNDYKVFNEETAKGNKCGNLWFERGKNEIHNIGETYRLRLKIGQTRSSVSTYAIMAECLLGIHWRVDSKFSYNVDKFNRTSYGFDAPIIQIEYETFAEETIKVSKEDKIKHPQNEIFDTQSANSVDLEHQTIFEYAKANRLASKIVEIYGEYEDESELPQLSDYIGNKILFSREMTFYKDGGIFFKGLLCENYILKDYFTGVNSKERSWNITDTNEAILRNDVQRVYAIFSSVNYAWLTSNFEYCNYLYRAVFDFSSFYAKTDVASCGIHGALIYTDNASACYLDVINTTESKSAKLFVSFDDNMKVGDQITKDDDIYTMDPISYVDANGETDHVSYYFAPYFEPLVELGQTWKTKSAELGNTNTFVKADYDAILDVARKYPRSLGSHSNYFKVGQTHYKDNREIPSLTFQVEYMSREENIIVKDDIAKIMPISNGSLNPQEAINDWEDNIGAKFIRNDVYTKEETIARGTDTPLSVGVHGTGGVSTYAHISVSAVIGENDSWCIYSKLTGKILLAVNKVGDYIYGVLDACKDEKIYNNQLDQKVIGTVYDTSEEIAENYEQNPQEVHSIKLYDRTIEESDITKDF